MHERRDLGVTLVGATMLMFSMVYLAQCSSRPHASGPADQTSPTVQGGRGASAEGQAERRAVDKGDDEESVRVKSIGHAIQTIGANPELRKTYGVDQ